MEDYRVEVTVKNNRVLYSMQQMGYTTVHAFCVAHGLSQTVVGGLINLKRAAIDSGTGRWTPTALRVAEALACSPDDLWTDVQRVTALARNKRTTEISEDQAIQIMYADQDAHVLQLELSEAVEAALKTLTPREEQVIRMRMGFEPYCETCTLDAAATEFGVTRERIRQVEIKALRKLKRPCRAALLEDFV